MTGLRLNQITLAAKDMGASLAFYESLGLKVIVNSAPRYVRFEFPGNSHGDPATISLHEVEEDWEAPKDWPLIYFEVDDLDGFIKSKSLHPVEAAETKTYLWREADIVDPAGNKIRLFQAGENRRSPPWRI